MILETPANPTADQIRLDKWLWQARFFKSRTLAAEICRQGNLRVNGQAVSKANENVALGDVLTIPLGQTVRLVRILGLGERRGPYREAAALYEEIKSGP